MWCNVTKHARRLFSRGFFFLFLDSTVRETVANFIPLNVQGPLIAVTMCVVSQFHMTCPWHTITSAEHIYRWLSHLSGVYQGHNHVQAAADHVISVSCTTVLHVQSFTSHSVQRGIQNETSLLMMEAEVRYKPLMAYIMWKPDSCSLNALSSNAACCVAHLSVAQQYLGTACLFAVVSHQSTSGC